MTRLKTLRGRVAIFDARKIRPAPKRADPHYLTPEHRRWRSEIIRRAGNACEKCGAHGRSYSDHVIELRDGGDPLDVTNGMAMCPSCHTLKTNRARAVRDA